MGRQEQREAAALAAGWRPHPTFTEASRKLTAQHPDLRLRVWADIEGVHVYAFLEHWSEDGGRHHVEVARAVWRPREVTEVAVVDWGRRALAHWLESQLLPTEEQELRD